jgi:DSF synthase
MTHMQKKFGLPTLVTDNSGAAAFGEDVSVMQSLVPAADEVAAARYDNIDVELDPEAKTYWCYMRGKGNVTQGLLDDLSHMQNSMRRMFVERKHEPEKPFDYFVFASRIPGTFSLGGDLAMFADKIRSADRETLTHYAHSCIDVVHNNHVAFDLPVVTMALVQGDALGGGLESALSMDMIVAERSAKMGLPEILFNLFPGMGAYSFLSRKLDAARAEKMILSGRVYSAEELHEMGVVDVLVEDGQGEEGIREYIDRQTYRHNAYRGVFQMRRRVNTIPKEELIDVVDIWVDAVMNLKEADMRKMARLTAAQDRRRVALNAASIAALSAE